MQVFGTFTNIKPSGAKAAKCKLQLKRENLNKEAQKKKEDTWKKNKKPSSC